MTTARIRQVDVVVEHRLRPTEILDVAIDVVLLAIRRGEVPQQARAHGFCDAQDDFEADPNAKPSTQPPPPGDKHYTDMGNGARFARKYRQTLCYVNVNDLLGFEIGDLKTGKMLHRIEVRGFEKGPVLRHGCPSHGIGLTPDSVVYVAGARSFADGHGYTRAG